MHSFTHLWDWLWIGLMTVTWLAVIGAFVYAAVTFARSHDHRLLR